MDPLGPTMREEVTKVTQTRTVLNGTQVIRTVLNRTLVILDSSWCAA